jgi:serine protease inhibitor
MAAVHLHTDFGVALVHALPAAAEENFVVSPWSVSSALAVLAPGVDDQGRREIEHALAPGAVSGDLPADLATAAARVAHERAPGDDSVLAVANTLWVDDGRTPAPRLVRHLERWPGAALRSVPLCAAPERARATINADVAQTTRNLIPAILPRGSITPEDRAVIVNALYLLAGWFERFAEPETTDEPFHSPSGTHEVPTMRGWREARYAENGWRYVALPLWLGLEAEILLPPATAAPHVATRTLDRTVLVDLRHEATGHRVRLHLPRFRVEWDTDLIPVLRALGVNRIFDPGRRALVDVVVEERLYVSGAFHAAVLQVDERGVEGAAATAVVAPAAAYHRLRSVELRIDRPFFFLITHRGTGAVIFLAHIAEPCHPKIGT